MSPQVMGNSGLLVLSATHSAVDVFPTPGIRLEYSEALEEDEKGIKSDAYLTWFAVQQNN